MPSSAHVAPVFQSRTISIADRVLSNPRPACAESVAQLPGCPDLASVIWYHGEVRS